MVIDTAKSVNMPGTNVQRAIERGMGQGKEALEEVIYEGFGPGQVAFIIEGVTDNRLRINQKIRSIFEKNGGHLVGQGAVSYMFTKIGEIRVKGKGGDREEEILELIDLGVEDVEDYMEESFDSAQDKNIQKYLVYIESSELNTMSTKITQAGFEVESQEIVMKPNTTQKIDDPDLAKRVVEFAEKLEEQDDVQRVYSNIEIPL